MASAEYEALAALPKPRIIQELDYDAIRSARIQYMVDNATRYGMAYDVERLKSDPAVVVIEDAAYRETLLRARGNDIARAGYLFYAVGSEVDHKGQFHDCYRMPGEDDDRYKERIILAIRGRSTGGTEPRYEGAAMAASLRVQKAKAYTLLDDPTIYIAIVSTDNDGVADEALLDAVRAAVTAVDHRMVNDRIVVRAAVRQFIAVAGEVWLRPEASETLLDTLKVDLPKAWANGSALGDDLTAAWLTARLMVPGVHDVRITAPADKVGVQPFEAVRIQSVTLVYRGRGA